MTPTASTTLARLFSAAPSVLTDKEVRASLRDELNRERALADEAMQDVIAKAEKRVSYLSSAIFDPIEKIEHWLTIARRSQEQAEDRMKTKAEPDLYLAVIQCAVYQQEVELEAALKLRAIRLPISHTDPACYWDDLRAARDSLPIIFSRGA